MTTVYYNWVPGKTTAFPNGLRMITPGEDVFDEGKTSGEKEMEISISFQSCWDGVNLDSDDHMSHVAFPKGDKENSPCPSSHPVRIPRLDFFIRWFNTKTAKWRFSDGTTRFHADYISGWDENFLQTILNGSDGNFDSKVTFRAGIRHQGNDQELIDQLNKNKVPKADTSCITTEKIDNVIKLPSGQCKGDLISPAGVCNVPSPSISWKRQSYDDISLSVGDSLTFNYDFHNVIKANKSQFENCSGGTMVGGFNEGPYTATFEEAGTYYYYCSVGSHCPLQRVKVIVSAGSPTTSSPSSAPSPLSSESPVGECVDASLRKFTHNGKKLKCHQLAKRQSNFVTKVCKKSSVSSKCEPVCEDKCECKDDEHAHFDIYLNNGQIRKRKCSFLFGKKTSKIQKLCKPGKSNAKIVCPWACAYYC
mmetsp:Transcript_20574/g.28944  ORF Transcript_20574/g.28944 Transcript_20574/m.28944 type:complete len:420 (+) Transcript_20574:334-1593(+)